MAKPPSIWAPLATAYREYDARLRSGWDTYAGAIAEARKGKPSRLIDLLHARRPLADADFDGLAEYVARRGPGRPRHENVREAARLAESLIAMTGARGKKRERVIEYACKAVKQWRDASVDRVQVADVLNRPAKRRK